MKINDNHISQKLKQAWVLDEFTRLHTEYVRKEYIGNEHANEDLSYIRRTFKEILTQDTRPYLMKKSALAIADKIKIDGSFHPKIFDKFENNMKGQVVVGDHEAYLYWRDSTKIRGMRVYFNTETKYFGYDSFCIIIASGEYSSNYDEIKDIVDRFVKIITFIHFSELETVVLAPKGKFGTLKTPDRWKNESDRTFIILDCTWNKTSIRSEGFTVSGHMRLQPCGTGMWDRKLIFIQEFEKTGYVRTAKKELCQ